VLGVRRPELVAGVFIHSGVACGAASSALAAFNVLKRGADTDVAAIAREARAPRGAPFAAGAAARGAGRRRRTSSHRSTQAQLVRQYLVLNGHPAADAGAYDALPPPDLVNVETLPDARIVTTSEWRIAIARSLATCSWAGSAMPGAAATTGIRTMIHARPTRPRSSARSSGTRCSNIIGTRQRTQQRRNRTARESTWRRRDSTTSRSSPTTCRGRCSSTAICSV
jgi:hypothetical protein